MMELLHLNLLLLLLQYWCSSMIYGVCVLVFLFYGTCSYFEAIREIWWYLMFLSSCVLLVSLCSCLCCDLANIVFIFAALWLLCHEECLEECTQHISNWKDLLTHYWFLAQFGHFSTDWLLVTLCPLYLLRKTGGRKAHHTSLWVSYVLFVVHLFEEVCHMCVICVFPKK